MPSELPSAKAFREHVQSVVDMILALKKTGFWIASRWTANSEAASIKAMLVFLVSGSTEARPDWLTDELLETGAEQVLGRIESGRLCNAKSRVTRSPYRVPAPNSECPR